MTHKGSRAEALMIAELWNTDPEWNPNEVHPELFNEQNFTSTELLQFTKKVTDLAGANLLVNHPNADASVKAALVFFLFNFEE